MSISKKLEHMLVRGINLLDGGFGLSRRDMLVLKLLEAKAFLYSASPYPASADNINALEIRKFIKRVCDEFPKAHYDLSNMYELTDEGKALADRIRITGEAAEWFQQLTSHGRR